MYSSVFDVRNALTPGASSSDATTASSLSEAQIVDAINEADSRIDGYLPADYTVPMQEIQQSTEDPLPPPQEVAHNLIRFWSRDIAAYLATLTFKRNKDVSSDDPVRLRYNMAMSDLEKVARGILVLPPDATPGDEVGNVFIANQYEGRMFGLEDFDLTTSRRPREWDVRIHDGSV